MFKKQKSILLVSILTLFVFMLVGCGGGDATPDGDVANQEKGKVEIVYVEWACANASTHVMADILENIMGYETELYSVAAAAIFQALANDEADATFTTWLPLTHGDYMKQVEGKVENLGSNYEGAKIGLVVPDYVEIDSIEELNGAKDKFDGKIIGIDPGAGIMKASNQALEDYNLDYEVMEGSDATMVVSLKEAIRDNEWIAVTGWSPHWKFAEWDLKYLEDPKKSFGEAETIDTVVRLGLKEDMPEVYELFNNFKWDDAAIGSAMNMIEEAGDAKVGARKWVEENQDLVNSWLPEKYKK
ncbi:MAG TPA: glycine betaine ABC transporter substrate-binding protein [Syntrophomonadaceae bacterium]|nr:glycine betaine ABC transporter substrate-binding protein [Syntrophomonadaceae bacterium]